MDWDGESDDASRFSKDVMTAVNPKQIPPARVKTAANSRPETDFILQFPTPVSGPWPMAVQRLRRGILQLPHRGFSEGLQKYRLGSHSLGLRELQPNNRPLLLRGSQL